MKQYRTLREGDRRLPGYECRLRYVPHAQWVPSDAVGIIDADDIRRAEYRVPCSATVAPDGFEVVDPARLPKDARVGKTWLRREPEDDRWSGMGGGWGWVMDTTPRRIVYAAPADELAALYAQGDAEREQSAAASASPWVAAAERQPPLTGITLLRLRGSRSVEEIEERDGFRTLECGEEWLDLAAVDRLAAECEELRRERDEARAEVKRLQGCVDASRRRADRAESGLEAVTKAYEASRAEVERLRGEVHRITEAVNEMIRGSYEAGLAVLDAARAALEGRDG